MRVNARVIKTDGKTAIVESERLSACEGCHKHAEGCTVCSLMGGNSIISARAKNNIGAKVGDEVEIETETKKVLFYAMLVFILPLAVMLAIYAFASVLALENTVRYLLALCGFVLCFFFIWLYSKFTVNKRCDADIIKIIEKKD